MIELISLDPTLRLDIRYATPHNFTGQAVYAQARAFLQRPAAEAVVRANQALHAQGYGLLIFDGYRPWSVTKIFWDVTPPEKHRFVANPDEGSRHNRGCAVDLSLCDLATGQEVPMPTPFDEMTPRSYARSRAGTPAQRRTREILREAMEAEGFHVNPTEWWHFDHETWRNYPVLDIPFEKVAVEVPAHAAAGSAPGAAATARR